MVHHAMSGAFRNVAIEIRPIDLVKIGALPSIATVDPEFAMDNSVAKTDASHQAPALGAP